MAEVPLSWDEEEEMRDNDAVAKDKAKTYADEKFKHKITSVECGDNVLVKRFKRTKWETKNKPEIFTVIARKGPAVTIQGEKGETYTRDVSQLVPLAGKTTDSHTGYNLGGDSTDSDSNEEPHTSSRGEELNVSRGGIEHSVHQDGTPGSHDTGGQALPIDDLLGEASLVLPEHHLAQSTPRTITTRRNPLRSAGLPSRYLS